MSAIDDVADFGPYRFGTDNAYHTDEREAEKQALVTVAERFGLRINVALAALAQPARGPSERARARLDFLERENAALRREVFAAETHRERELIDLQVEIRRLQRQGHDVATLARAVRGHGSAAAGNERAKEAMHPKPARTPHPLGSRVSAALAMAHRSASEGHGRGPADAGPAAAGA